MKKVLLLLAALILLSAGVSAQDPQHEKNEYAGEMPNLQGLNEAFMINGRPALRILTRKSGYAEVMYEIRDGREALVFPVYQYRSFALGIMLEGEGRLYVTKDQVVYQPNADREHFFSSKRADLKDVDIKKTGMGLDIVTFGVNGDKKRLTLSQIMTINRRDSKPAMTFFYHSIINFDAALKLFNELTAGVRQKLQADEVEPEEEPSADISDKYDRFRDITIVSTSRMLVKGLKRSIRAQAQYSFPGETQAKPDKVTLLLYVSAANPVLSEDDLALNFLVDGKRVPLGDMKLNEEKGKSVVKQTLTVILPYETFRQIADGKKVEFQVGALEYTLADAHREAFRNLLSYHAGGDSK
jgi:hypothetical protein